MRAVVLNSLGGKKLTTYQLVDVLNSDYDDFIALSSDLTDLVDDPEDSVPVFLTPP